VHPDSDTPRYQHYDLDISKNKTKSSQRRIFVHPLQTTTFSYPHHYLQNAIPPLMLTYLSRSRAVKTAYLCTSAQKLFGITISTRPWPMRAFWGQLIGTGMLSLTGLYLLFRADVPVRKLKFDVKIWC
jgi:hypothetical protein